MAFVFRCPQRREPSLEQQSDCKIVVCTPVMPIVILLVRFIISLLSNMIFDVKLILIFQIIGIKLFLRQQECKLWRLQA